MLTIFLVVYVVLFANVYVAGFFVVSVRADDADIRHSPSRRAW